jgi:hypothetical protein
VQIDLDELARLAAREYIALALEAERRAYLEGHAQLLVVDHLTDQPRPLRIVWPRISRAGRSRSAETHRGR